MTKIKLDINFNSLIMYSSQQELHIMTKQEILNLLNTSDRAIARALVAINKRQTSDEQVSRTTTSANGMGFTPSDAYMGTSMAKFYNKNRILTTAQLDYWKMPNAKGVPRINKYANQLLTIANTI